MTFHVKDCHNRTGASALAVVIGLMAVVGFAKSAHAVCTKPKAVTAVSTQACSPPGPNPPYTFNAPLDNATVSGTATPSNESITSNSNLANNGGTLTNTSTLGNKTAKVWLPHTYVKVHRYVSNGTPYLRVYISTQSDYAPNGDSGTFVFNKSGNLVSGSQAALNRIQAEAQEADPQTATQVNGIIGWFEDHASRIEACGEFAGGVVVAAAGIATGVGASSTAVGLLTGGAGLIGGADLMSKTATKCF